MVSLYVQVLAYTFTTNAITSTTTKTRGIEGRPAGYNNKWGEVA